MTKALRFDLCPVEHEIGLAMMQEISRGNLEL